MLECDCVVQVGAAYLLTLRVVLLMDTNMILAAFFERNDFLITHLMLKFVATIFVNPCLRILALL